MDACLIIRKKFSFYFNRSKERKQAAIPKDAACPCLNHDAQLRMIMQTARATPTATPRMRRNFLAHFSHTSYGILARARRP